MAPPSLPRGVILDDGLTRDEAVAIALWNQPAFQASLARLGFAKADLLRAGALPNPVLSLLFPLGPKQMEMGASWDLSWLWKRPARVTLAKLDVERVAEELTAAGLDLATEVRRRHAQLVYAARKRELAAQAESTLLAIASLTDRRVAAGAASDLEALSVRADARAATLEVQRRDRQIEIATAELMHAMGWPMPPHPPRLVPSPTASQALPLDAAIQAAYAARPELRAAELQIERAGRLAGLSTAQVFSLVAVMDANDAPGSRDFEVGPGMQLALPIFDRGQGDQEQARAELSQASYRYLQARRSIARDVRTAHARLREAQDTLQAWPEQVLVPREKALGLAKRAFELGGASYLVVLEETRRLIAAQERTAELELDVRTAEAELARGVGRDLNGRTAP